MVDEPKAVAEETGIKKIRQFDSDAWHPKTELGRKVKSGEIKDFDEILASGHKILEEEVVDILLPDLQVELLLLGQSKCKFG